MFLFQISNFSKLEVQEVSSILCFKPSTVETGVFFQVWGFGNGGLGITNSFQHREG